MGKAPNIQKFLSDYEILRKNFEDLKKIVLAIPINNLSFDNINKLENSLTKLKSDSKIFIESISPNQYYLDFFKGGTEANVFCKRLKIDSNKFFEMKDFFEELAVFDIKKFIVENKEN